MKELRKMPLVEAFTLKLLLIDKFDFKCIQSFKEEFMRQRFQRFYAYALEF